MTRSALLGIVVCTLATAGCNLFDRGSDPDLGTRGVGEPCTTTAYCRAGLLCTMSVCAPSGAGRLGEACQLTGDCSAGLYCGPSRTCTSAGTSGVGGDCASTADCEAGLVCRIEGFGGACRAPGSADVGDACTSEFDCLAGLGCLAWEGSRVCQSPPAIDLGDGGVVPPEITPWPGVSCETDDGPPTAYFQVPRGTPSDGDFFRLPFPSDVRLTPLGLDLSGFPTPGDASAVDVLGRTVAAAETDLDGWSTNPVVYFRFSRPYEGGDIGGHVRWVDVTPGSPEYGRDLGIAWITTSGSITRYVCPDWVAFRQGHGAPLRPGTTYAVILTIGVRTATTLLPFQRSPDLDAVLGDTMPADTALQHAWRTHAPLRDWLATQTDTLPSREVLSVALFTTQTIEGDVPAMREIVRARPAPALHDVTVCADGVTSPCDDGTPQRRCGPPSAAYTEIHARVTLPIFQEGEAPYEESGGAIAREADGTPRVVRDEDVCMMMTIPTGAPPAEGWPVVIAAHGTGGSFTGPVSDGMAEAWATGEVGGAPVRAATISWDAPQHGARRGTSTRPPERLVFGFANPPAARDVWLQGAADLLSLVYFAESYSDAPAGETVSFDPTRIAIFAHSQGATHAALMTPFEPSLAAIVFSGVGGDLSESLLTKTEPLDIAHVVPLALSDPDGAGALSVGEYHPALSIIQTFYDRVDPVNVGRRMWREPLSDTDVGRHVFMTYGLGDHFSPERTMGAFARSASLPLVGDELATIGIAPVPAPVSGNVTVSGAARTAGVRQYVPPSDVDGHFVSTTTGRDDVLRFLLEALAGGTPTIGS